VLAREAPANRAIKRAVFVYIVVVVVFYYNNAVFANYLFILVVTKFRNLLNFLLVNWIILSLQNLNFKSTFGIVYSKHE
jgi:hypothetical protein